jgi:hypothetical protein
MNCAEPLVHFFSALQIIDHQPPPFSASDLKMNEHFWLANDGVMPVVFVVALSSLSGFPCGLHANLTGFMHPVQ